MSVIMDMAAINKGMMDDQRIKKSLLLLLLVSGLSCGKALALNWVVRPSINFEETYSDNINQSNTNQRSALVTEVSPAISVRSTSSINTFNLNYRMQNLYNAGGNSGIDINNQLQFDSTYQLKRNSLYLDTRSTISQQNISNRNIASDNITGSSDSTTVSTFSISPYWTPHLKSFANGEVRLTYDRVSTNGGQSALSSTDSFSQNIRLNSGRDFSRFSWFVTFDNRDSYYSDRDDVSFQSSTAELRGYLDRKFSAFIRVGHSDNQFESTTDSNRNGVFYTVGAQWRPSLRFSVEAGYGNNAFVTVNISPIRRITWSTTYFNNDIGTNRGDRWQSSLQYNTRRSVWSFNYSENTTTTQQLLLQEVVFIRTDAFGNIITDPVNGQPLLFAIDLPSLTDEVLINKRADLSVSFQTGKSTYNLGGFRSRREFQSSQNREDVYGVNGSWEWNFARRTRSNVRLRWQTIEGQDATSDDRFDAIIGVTRNIYSYLFGRVEYRFVNQQSDRVENEFSENRVSASLSLRF